MGSVPFACEVISGSWAKGRRGARTPQHLRLPPTVKKNAGRLLRFEFSIVVPPSFLGWLGGGFVKHEWSLVWEHKMCVGTKGLECFTCGTVM